MKTGAKKPSERADAFPNSTPTSLAILPPPSPGAPSIPSPVAAAGAPAAKQGSRAAEMAEEARKLRDVDGNAELGSLKQEAARASETPDNAPIRRVTGRLFALEEGVWKDTSANTDGRMIRIEPYNRACFDLLPALPEIPSWWYAFERVHLAAGELVLALEPGGSDELTGSEIRRIAGEFLQDEPTRP